MKDRSEYKTGRVQREVLEELPATVEEIEDALTPTGSHIVHSAILTLILRRWIALDSETGLITAADPLAIRDAITWRLPAPIAQAPAYKCAPSLAFKKLLTSLEKRDKPRSPTKCGDLWALGRGQTRMRLLRMERAGWIERLDDGRLIQIAKKGRASVPYWYGVK